MIRCLLVDDDADIQALKPGDLLSETARLIRTVRGEGYAFAAQAH